MNYLLNRPNYPFNDVKVPDGLEQLLSDISREVLREQPTTDRTYDFIASYLESLVNTRDTIDGIEALLNRIINRAADIAQNLRNDGLESKKADEAAEVVRCYFEKFVDEKRKEKYANRDFKFEEVDLVWELINRCKLTEPEVYRAKPIIFKAYRDFVTDYFKALEGAILPPELLNCVMQFTIDRYVKNKPSYEALYNAATIIQAAFKGYKVRKAFKSCINPEEDA